MTAARRSAAGCALLGALAAAAPAAAIPIPSPLEGPLPRFLGAPVAAQRLPAKSLPANPTLAPDGRSGSGLAPGNGAASPFPGPLGVGTTRLSALVPGSCASFGFDRRGRLLGLCNGPLASTLVLFDPVTLASIATLALPPRMTTDRRDVAGGTHFIVRADGSVLLPTTSGTLIAVAVEDRALRQTGTVNLAGLLAPREKVFAVAGGYGGSDWAVGAHGTVVGVPRNGAPPRAIALHEPVAEDIATDRTGTFVVTANALYRLKADGGGGRPRIIWRHAIPSGPGDQHAGRIHPGPGTPPVVLPGGFVAVADGRTPPRITVLRIAGPASRRLHCATPVFRAGASSVESHLVAVGRSIVVTNAYGYDNVLTTEGGRTTTGGIARVDVGRGSCRVAWTSAQISPTAQPVVSRATGLLYTLLKPAGFPDRWYLGALDWRTGQHRFSVLAGEGLGHNSEGGAVALGSDGAAYAGTFGGVVRFRDR